MVFSVRTLIVGVTVAGVWLAALFSGSELFLAVVAHLSLVFIAITLGLAMFDASPARRPFWAGFFVAAVGQLAVSSLPLGNITKPIRHIETALADVMQGDLSARPGAQEMVPMVRDGQTYYVPLASIAYDEERVNLRAAFAACFALVLGCVGGVVCLWFSREGRKSS